MDSPPSFPSSVSRIYEYDVFPSFFGEDIRTGIFSHIQKEFKRKGITLTDRRKSIGPGLRKAIKTSKIAIVLFSRNYASSTWCLDELVEILKCREELDQRVMTIFYEVDPTDVSKQSGYFGTVFKKTCVRKAAEDVERWRKALQQVAYIVGYLSRHWLVN